MQDYKNLFDDFDSAFITSLDTHLLKKTKWLRENNKHHIRKPLRQAVIKWSKLMNKLNKTKLLIDIKNYKKQRNYVVTRNRNAKFEYFRRYDCKDCKLFWVSCKPYISNKHTMADNHIPLNYDGRF